MNLRTTTALAAMAGTILTGIANPAHAEPRTMFQHYVSLGDSYAAVADHTSLRGEPGCFRSTKNYASDLAAMLGVRRHDDASCGDAKTENMTQPQPITGGVNPPQFDAITPDTDLVTVSIGGNDVGAVTALATCGMYGLLDRAGNPCQQMNGLESINGPLADVADRVGRVVEGIRARAPKATIVYVGYLAPLPEAGPCATTPIADGDIPYIKAVHKRMVDTFTAAASAHGALIVDASAVTGHDLCQPAGVRWVEPLLPSTITSPFHPNAAGQAAVADLIAAAL
ncbi:SGNH/GDSL hydrolase family protein [Antrihabitans stalactiti]|uniref:SGNH/GDSL hydrolase family protein n=1 Tax=Antrihabitans stalactiti TaxID=2584121 RepID=A0A848KL00_9NOCA|nr:SGNH/GDSL hydrolase family protein [Antrihabitans stalactiti]NMN98548.1 SGNH/GDSL hydrolase family protein [Antrihabitans stalactiti]